MRFLFTCGGTAGHINPALGVADRLKQLLPDAEFLFIGAEGRMETELVPREGYPIRTIGIDNLSRSLSLAGLKHNAHTARLLLHASGEAKKILCDFQPDVAVGTGGYVCYPALKAAHSLGIPTLVHEANAVPGLTTKLLARTVDCVMVGFEKAAENYPRGVRAVYTGMPVRGEFKTADRAAAREKLGLAEPEKPLLVSVWGSLGSGHINSLMPEFAALTVRHRDFNLIHSAGKGGYAGLSARTTGDAIADIREYIYDMPAVMAAADLVMCRSGASTLGELAALGMPALLVPSPNVTNHQQERNAALLEELGAARVLREGSFDAHALYRAAGELIGDPKRLSAMSEAMRRSGTPDAAGKIADLILDYVK